jgi:hypothetical protein
MTLRRLSLMFAFMVVLAGCSSGSSNVAGSTQSTSPKATSSTAPKATSSTASKATSSTAPKATKVFVGTAISFCAAFKEKQSVKASAGAAGAAAAGAAYQTIAAEMRKYAPTAIKDAAISYASVIDESGKALKSGTLPTLSAKSADLAKVTVWVSKNCPLK